MSDAAPFFRPGGTMDPSAPCYIERQADAEMLRALHAREYVFLLDSRQKGKSSMVARTIIKLRDAGVTAIKLDLQRIGANVTPEQWYAGLIAAVAGDLGLAEAAFKYWGQNQQVGPLARWIGALSEVILAKTSSPIVIFVDEVDFVRALPFPTDEFFAGIRDCYNRRSEGKGFDRLTFCFVGVATPGQLIRNPEITPFNIGRRIDLSDFTSEETKVFADVLQSNGKDGPKLMARIHYWLNGHPYLTQLLCSQIVGDPSTRTARDVDNLVRRLFLTPEARQREPNLTDVERRMLDPDVPGLSGEERRTQVLELYGRVLKGKRVVVTEENPVIATLRLSGVGLEDRRALRVRNRLYRLIFDEKWRRSSLPDAEVRRQRGAARVALLRTATVAGVVVFGVTGVAVNTNRLAADRQTALSQLKDRSKELSRVSEDRQRSLYELERQSIDLKNESAAKARSIADLKARDRDLRRISNLRQSALKSIRRQNQTLESLSSSRQRALQDLRQSTKQLIESNYVGQIQAISGALSQNHLMRAALYLDRARKYDDKGFEWGHAALRLGTHRLEKQLPRYTQLVKNIHGDIYAVAAGYRSQIHDTGIEEKTSYIPNTDYIQPFGPLLASRNLATLNTTVYNLSTFRQEYKVPEGAYLITDGPESKLCLYSRSNGTGYRITLHDIRLNRERWTVNSDEFIVLAHILREGNILTLGLSGKLSLWNSAGQPLASAETRPLPLGNYAKLTVSPDQSQFLIHNWDLSHIAIRSVKSLEVVKVFDGPQVRPLDSSYSPDGSQLAIATMDGLVRVYDVRSGQNTHALAGHLSTVASVEFMPGGREIASIDDNGWLRIWPLHQKSAVRTYPLELHPLRAGRISSDERIVVGHSMDGEFASMDIKSGTVFRKRIEQVKRYPASVYLGHDRIYVGTQEGYLQAVGLPRLETISNTKISEYSINRIWAALQNKVLLLECMSKTDAEYVVVSVPRLDVLTRFRLAKAFNPNILPSVTTSYHEKIGIFGFRTGEIFVHSLVTGRETRKLSIPRGFYSMARARLGKAVAIFKGSEAGVRRFEVVLLDLSNGKIIGTYMADMLPSLVLASHDEDRILLAIDDSGAAHFWDAETFRYLYRVFPGGRVYSVNFSADGRRFVVSSGSGMTTIHDSRSGEQLLNLSYEPLKGSTPPTGVLGDYASFMGTNDKVTMNCLDGAVRVFDSLPRQAPKPAPRTDISRKPERGTPPSSPKNPTAARPR